MTPNLARHIAARLEGMSNATARNGAEVLRYLADQVDSLNRAVELISADCARLVKERDQLRLEITEYKAQHFDRRTKHRP